MELIDYTGKLKEHEEYLKIINELEKYCKYIEIVIIDGKKSNEIVEQFKENVLLTKKVSEWWGTKTHGDNNLYRLKATKQLFAYLRKYETFCKYYTFGENSKTLKVGEYCEITDFGYDDIAFYDEKGNYLLFTTTHEGYITLDRKLIEEK